MFEALALSDIFELSFQGLTLESYIEWLTSLTREELLALKQKALKEYGDGFNFSDNSS